MCKPKHHRWALLASAALLTGACSDDDDTVTPPTSQNIVQVAAANPDFSSLVAAVTKAELVTTLSGPGPFTVFAPTNAAFAALLTQLGTTLDGLTKEQLAPILTYHVLSGQVGSQQVVGLKGATTVNGADIRIRTQAGQVFLTAGNGNDIRVTTTDIQASNGVIHVIDKVMLPPKDIPGVATDTPSLSTLVAALTRANLVNDLKAAGPFTVFAPTNEAFAALLASNPAWTTLNDIPIATLTEVLKYHVVPMTKAYSEKVVTLTKVSTLAGKDVTIDASAGVKLNGTTNVTLVDVLASNGVVHVIDKVLLPPASPAPQPQPQTIVDVAVSKPELSSLVAAVQKAELVTTLSGAGPFTVFAPTNEAFTALLSALNTSLDALTKEALTPILTYHVVPGAVKAAQVVGLKGATTVNGADIRIRVEAGKVFLTAGNGADIQVTMTDIEASNGVIHVINKVMVPPKTIPEVATANPNFSSLAAALQRANLVTALQAPGPFTVFAPTNEAFAALLASNPAWTTLNDIPLETLVAVLQYHVVPGTKAYSETVVTLPKVSTLLTGKDVTIDASAGVKLNGTTTVTATDVLASNGVIHVIDKVLLPPN